MLSTGYIGYQGAAEKIKRENDVHLRQLAKKSTYVPSFFSSFFFSAFLGVSRQGEFEYTRKKLSTFQKKTPGKYFFRGKNFFWGIFQLFFLSIFLLRWLSASR
jgi:hypothetical protein